MAAHGSLTWEGKGVAAAPDPDPLVADLVGALGPEHVKDGPLELALPALQRAGGRIINVTSDAAVEPYDGWGGYGSSKAALEQLTSILTAEQPGVRVYAVDPGDMRTQMHQEAFPGEDISDRPLPDESVPGLLVLIEGDLKSGRYAARSLAS